MEATTSISSMYVHVCRAEYAWGPGDSERARERSQEIQKSKWKATLAMILVLIQKILMRNLWSKIRRLNPKTHYLGTVHTAVWNQTM